MQAESVPDYQMFVGGAWIPSHSGRNYPVFNPARGQVLAHVPKGDAEDVGAAVDAAKKAFQDPAWRSMDPSKRGRLLLKASQTLRERLSDFARLETLNNGKPLGQAKGDVAMAARHFEYFAGLADKIQGSTIPVPGNRLDYTVKEPLGVTAHVVPWNYPLVMAARSMAPALAAGNTVVAKPASFTPLTLLKFAELCKEAGFPDGVVNVVTGGGDEVGGSLVKHPDVRLTAVTGSVETGMQVMEMASGNLSRVILELGGKNPQIVFSDADLQRAAGAVLNGIFTNAGQMCWAGSRLLVEEGIRDSFVEKLVRGADAMKLGDGLAPDTAMGPLVADSQRSRVASYVRIGTDQGAKVVAGGAQPEEEELRAGYFYRPTILDGVTQEMKVARDEIFGPVLTVTTFDGQEDAVAKANDSDFGLWAGVWTKELRRAHRVAAALEAGIVAVNEEPTTFPQTPFGGFKRSGNSSEQGMDAVSSYVRIKNVSVNLD
ncbi:MAG TPA: aldehyde dehydrogenase family protein [Nitrososphaerales archaeon]|nr:aldehyde dehydrogenase family protein [Nitrososphaerales archaeon]